MHDMNGVQLAQKIRQDANLDKAMVLILLTDDNAFAEQFRTGQHGIQRVLLKPVLGEQLQQALMEEMEALQPLAGGLSAQYDKLRLLVAEDHSLSQKVIRSMLEKLGAQVDIVGNGLEAVAAVRNKPYDLVFMDCEMPEMDGFEATRQIRAWERTQSSRPLPIIALTAHVLHIHKEHALACGMNAHVGKPVEIKHLRDILTRFLPPADKAAPPEARQT
jgi:CheY-like chemotaxis protein